MSDRSFPLGAKGNFSSPYATNVLSPRQPPQTKGSGDKDSSLVDPSRPSQAYLQMLPDWVLLRTVYDGTRAMRLAGKLFLPQYQRESDEEYDRRLRATTLLNMLKEAVSNVVGRPFSKPLTVSPETSPLIVSWAEDVDLEGTNLNSWARRTFRDAVIDGYVHCLVDCAAAPKGITLLEERQLGAGRPYLVRISAQNLIAAYTANINGEKVCVHARIKETTTQLTGFTEVMKERVRVLEPGYFWLYERGASGWTVVDEGDLLKASGEVWDRVPLLTFYSGAHDQDYVCTPPFIDLAYVNVEHWQSSSDQRNILTKSRFPMLAARGVSPQGMVDETGKMVVGPHTTLFSEDPAGMFYYVEPGGAAIAAGEVDLKRLVEMMRQLAMDPVSSRQGEAAQTATGRSIDEAKARAPLEVWARDFTEFLTHLGRLMLEWVGEEATVGIEVAPGFSLGSGDSTEVAFLMQMRGMRDLTRQSLFAEMKRRGVLAEHFNSQLEEAMLELESEAGMGFGGAPAGPPPGEPGAEGDEQPGNLLPGEDGSGAGMPSPEQLMATILKSQGNVEIGAGAGDSQQMQMFAGAAFPVAGSGAGSSNDRISSDLPRRKSLAGELGDLNVPEAQLPDDIAAYIFGDTLKAGELGFGSGALAETPRLDPAAAVPTSLPADFFLPANQGGPLSPVELPAAEVLGFDPDSLASVPGVPEDAIAAFAGARGGPSGQPGSLATRETATQRRRKKKN